MDKKAIEARIAELKAELSNVEGGPTEVYSRIVGYYRSVRNWNAGKREEYGQRLTFGFPGQGDMAAHMKEEAASAVAAPRAAAAPASAPRAAASAPAAPAELKNGVLVFTRDVCPNCPPVKNFVVSSGIKAVFVDVDREEGLALARDHGVMATPTVLGLDEEGRESFRALDVKSLRERLDGIAASKPKAGQAAVLKL